MNQPLLRVQNLNKTFHRHMLGRRIAVHAVRDVNFSLQKGEVLAIVGESGSGKSTVARMISRLIRPTTGSISLDGVSIYSTRAATEIPKRIQMVFQDPFGSFNPSHSVGYTIARPLSIHHPKLKGIKARTLELLDFVGLSPADEFIDKFPFQLSGGQRQRVMLARVLGLRPDIIILDEPTSMLDVSIGTQILNTLLDLKETNRLSYIFITHNLASARYMADRILVMFAGQVVEMGSVEEIIQAPKHPYTQLLLRSSPDPRRQTVDLDSDLDDTREPAAHGCAFQHRCPFVKKACTETEIEISQVRDHHVRCLLYSDL